jgi:HSP20 family molecular chaperone IbpA
MLLWTLPATERTAPVRRGTLMPPADVIDDGDAYRVIVELPGVAESDVVIDLEGSALTVHATRPAYAEGTRLLYQGRFAERAFEKQFTLGDDIDRSHVAAQLRNGLLQITLPRKAEEKPRRIAVEVRPSITG